MEIKYISIEQQCKILGHQTRLTNVELNVCSLGQDFKQIFCMDLQLLMIAILERNRELIVN